MGAAFGRVISALEDHGRRVRSTGLSRASAQCPAHEDQSPSLSVTGTEGRTLVYCQAGCSTVDVLASLQLTMAALFDDFSGAAYQYDNGRTVLRSPDKRFSQRNTDKPPQLYRLAQVRAAVAAGRPVYVVEGEADVHAAEAVGVVATCSPMGAGKWAKVDPSPLYGADVVVVADKDDSGRRHAQDVADSLAGKVKSLVVVQAAVGKDLSDHIAADRSLSDLVPAGIVAEDPFSAAVAEAAVKLRVAEAARTIVQAENSESASAPKPINLQSFLNDPDAEVAYRINDLWPCGGRVLLAAAQKAGKTTLAGNLIRCLVDGEPFLERYPTSPAQRVVLIDDELHPDMLRRWLREHRITNTSAVDVIPLRGRVSTFEILTPAGRRRWAEIIGSADVLIFDCLRPALDALGLSEDKDAGRFLVAFDALLAEAGIRDAVLVHHMGHSNERARGDSRLLDWPDAVWRLVRERDDDDAEVDPATAKRYFSAYGRDVNEPESLLTFDPVGRRLTIGGGNRRDTKALGALEDVLAFLKVQTEGVSGRHIEEGMRASAHSQKAIRDAVKKAIRDRDILVESGPKRAVLHTLNSSCASVRQSALSVRQRSESECVSASIETHTHTLPQSTGSPSASPTHTADPPPATPEHSPLAGCGHPLKFTAESTGKCAVCIAGNRSSNGIDLHDRAATEALGRQLREQLAPKEPA